MYARDIFTADERAILGRFFTNTDSPVFALINLPEVVKGALFARYSRSPKSLRRLFLDEFYSQPEVGIEELAEDSINASLVSLKRAEGLYDRVFSQYGDDSVAQLGAAHIACEQASNILTKVAEYLSVGVDVVVVIDPGTESAHVYFSDVAETILQNSDRLELPDVLPGFSVAVKELLSD